MTEFCNDTQNQADEAKGQGVNQRGKKQDCGSMASYGKGDKADTALHMKENSFTGAQTHTQQQSR
jgi:hypothetical protein